MNKIFNLELINKDTGYYRLHIDKDKLNLLLNIMSRIDIFKAYRIAFRDMSLSCVYINTADILMINDEFGESYGYMFISDKRIEDLKRRLESLNNKISDTNIEL